MGISLQENLVQDFMSVAPPHSRLPRLDLGIDWVPRWEEFRSSIRDALSGPRPEGGNEAVSGGNDLRVEWVRNYRPGGPLLLAAIGHVLAIWLLMLPIWGFLPQPENTLAPLDVEVNWYVPADLPSILLPAKMPAHSATQAESPNKEAARGADAYHPRQTILSVPVRMTHPRQTLIRPDAPMRAPKVVEQMPNIVQWAAPPQIQKPAITYSAGAAQLRERQVRRRETAAPQLNGAANSAAAASLTQPSEVKLAPPAPVANDAKVMAMRKTARAESAAAPQIAAATRDASPLDLAPSGDLHLAPPAPVVSDAKVIATHRSARVETAAAPQIANSSRNATAMNLAPAGEVNLAPPAPLPSNAVPVAARRDAVRNSAAAPELGAQANGNPADVRRLIAISANPAPPAADVHVPQGNLAANISISPDGTHRGTPSGAGHDTERGAAKSSTPSVGSGANSLPAAISISSANAKSVIPAIPAGAPGAVTAASSAKAAAAKVAALPPGAEPEKLLTSQMFTEHVSTPNTTSTRGSWIFHFAQLGLDPYSDTKPMGQLAGPMPIHTIDPRYPPETMAEHITGEVVLYAIIRKDGSVDSIQVVRSLDPRLDQAAVDALAHWQFRPGARAGEAVDIEAVIHVPFEYRQLNY
jgi:TonB family protein